MVTQQWDDKPTAPVAKTESAAILTWQERVGGTEYTPIGDFNAMMAEIADLRAALPSGYGELVYQGVCELTDSGTLWKDLTKEQFDKRNRDGDDTRTLYSRPEPVSAAPVVLVDRNAVLDQVADLVWNWASLDDMAQRRKCYDKILSLKSAAPASPIVQQLLDISLHDPAVMAQLYVSPGVPLSHELMRLATYDKAALNVPQLVAPQGYAIVPIKPNSAMLEAAAKADDEGFEAGRAHGASGREIYDAMLAAAPVAPAVQDAPSDEQCKLIGYLHVEAQEHLAPYRDAGMQNSMRLYVKADEDRGITVPVYVAAPVSGEVVRPDLAHSHALAIVGKYEMLKMAGYLKADAMLAALALPAHQAPDQTTGAHDQAKAQQWDDQREAIGAALRKTTGEKK